MLKQLFIYLSWIDINTGVFLREMCRRKIPKGTSYAMFDVRALAKCCEFKRCTSNRFDSLRMLLCYDKHRCFSWENVFGTPQKPWLWTEKKQKALALLGLASGSLANAVNSNVVPTEFAAEPTT